MANSYGGGDGNDGRPADVQHYVYMLVGSRFLGRDGASGGGKADCCARADRDAYK